MVKLIIFLAYEKNHFSKLSRTRRCMKVLDQTFLHPRRTDGRIRAFDSSQFAYYNTGTVAKQMCIYLVLAIELEALGYSLYGSANISGRYNIDSDTRAVSPHTW